MTLVIRIDANRIIDTESFHTLFASVFGFPDFYGNNMNAWIDCMSYLDDEEVGMSKVHVPRGCALPLVIENVQDFKRRCPELFHTFVESAAFVNWRCVEAGKPPLLALAFDA